MAVALVLGLFQAWANRFYMENDGVPYLDMADAYLRGDWHTALNGYWNPLYAWLIGLDFLIFRPSAYWEYPAVQLLNFACYALTVASFEYFLRGVLARKPANDLAVRFIAYAIFLWASLVLIRVFTANADMLVAASVFTASGILVRAHTTKTASVPTLVCLGLTLVAGYYCKAVMFPLSVFFLFLAWAVLGWRRSLLAASVFVLAAAPLVAGISKTTGRLTFGGNGQLVYSWYVNGVPFRWWQGGPAAAGKPLHPPRVALDSPRIYEFGGDFPSVTYSIWYDSTYWYRGLHVQSLPRLFAKTAWSNFKGVVKVLLLQGGGFLLGLGICFFRSNKKRQVLPDFGSMWPVLAASVAGILLYCAVHVEPRYIGAFVAMPLLAAYVAARIPERRLAAAIAIVGLLWSLGFSAVTASLGHKFLPFDGAKYVPWDHVLSNVSWQAATGLQQLGLRANDRVGSVCYSNRNNVFWARLARVHIIAEPDWDVRFWQPSDVDQRRVLEALARAGAVMAVSDETPPDPARAVGWRQAASTNYYAYSLSQLPALVQNSWQ
ncbi:MAG: hypothetical protein WBV60_17825 [Terriglobales bacterium]